MILFLALGLPPLLAQFLQQDTIFVSDTTVALSDITVTAQRNIIKRADKIIYKVDPSAFVAQTRAENVLKQIPSLSVNGADIRIDNYKAAKVYIDGMPAGTDEMNHLNVEDIASIEVIENPSAIYGSEFTGGVVNIIRKQRKERFYMGEIEGYASARLGLFGVNPSLSFKAGPLTVNSYYSFVKNNQDIHSVIERDYLTEKELQENDRETRGGQHYAFVRSRLDFNDKDKLVASLDFDRVRFRHANQGRLSKGDQAEPIGYESREHITKYDANLYYSHQFSRTSRFDAKGRYFNYATDFLNSYTDTRSKIHEGSGELFFEKRAISLFENPLDMVFDYKAIFRRYLTGVENAWLSSQQVHSLNASLSYAIGNVSLYGSLSFDQTRQSIGESVLHDHHFLPVASLTYTNPELLDIRLNYARKITRPGVDDLNPAYTQIDPLTIQCGNTDLEAGLNNSLSLRLSRNVSNSTLSLTGFHNQNKQVIGLVMIPQGERLIYTYDNIGKIRSSGLRMGWYCSLPAGVYLNASVGPTHRDFRFSDPRSVVQENGGWAFSTFVNAGMTIKRFLSIYLNLTHDNREYLPIGTIHSRPMVGVGANANLKNGKWIVGLNCMDVGGWSATRHTYTRGANFNQHAMTRNNMMNFTLSIRYTFGKTFDNNLDVERIDNSDIRTK